MKRVLTCIILLCALLVSIYYGFQKSGFHEDEYYTYFSSNRTLGLYQPDRQWQDRATILDEFTVKRGEGFNYGLVKLVQSWDVHPPIYYFIFHTACSLCPGIFTKWSGIIVNLIAFVISFVMMALLMNRLRVPDYIRYMVLIFWGLNPQTVSCNILIRMYAWLTAAIMICAFLHVRFMQEYQERNGYRKQWIGLILPIMVISYIGFLIQYFYLFFFVSVGFALTLWLIFVKKDIKEAIIYVISCGVSLGFAVLTYPASLRHMFGGYRGSDAAGSLFDIANTGMRVSFFVGLVNRFVFSNGLIIVVLMLILSLMMHISRNRKIKGIRYDILILVFGTLGYFLLTAKSALLVGSASNRYEMPIYGLLILLILWDLFYVIEGMNNKAYMLAMAAVIMAFLLKGHTYDKNVLFLYREDVAKIQYAQDNSSEIAVVMFNPATAHNIWRLTDELLQYPQVFYMNEENLEPIAEESIIGADKIILYAADDDKQKEAFANLLDSCVNLSGMQNVSNEDMWTTYEVQ